MFHAYTAFTPKALSVASFFDSVADSPVSPAWLIVKSPSTPGDAVGELSLFPAHGCVNAGEQEYDEARLLVGLGVPQQAEQVIYVDPCAVRAVLE
eukprot:s4014_g1.t1